MSEEVNNQPNTEQNQQTNDQSQIQNETGQMNLYKRTEGEISLLQAEMKLQTMKQSIHSFKEKFGL